MVEEAIFDDSSMKLEEGLKVESFVLRSCAHPLKPRVVTKLRKLGVTRGDLMTICLFDNGAACV